MKTERRGFLKGVLGAVASRLALRPTQDMTDLKVPEAPKRKPPKAFVPERTNDLTYVHGGRGSSLASYACSGMLIMTSDMLGDPR